MTATLADAPCPTVFSGICAHRVKPSHRILWDCALRRRRVMRRCGSLSSRTCIRLTPRRIWCSAHIAKRCSGAVTRMCALKRSDAKSMLRPFFRCDQAVTPVPWAATADALNTLRATSISLTQAIYRGYRTRCHFWQVRAAQCTLSAIIRIRVKASLSKKAVMRAEQHYSRTLLRKTMRLWIILSAEHQRALDMVSVASVFLGSMPPDGSSHLLIRLLLRASTRWQILRTKPSL